MVFIAHNDILVIEKEKGTMKRIVNGTLLAKPLLDLNVATKIDRGLLGVSFSKNSDRTKYVFLYYTETRSKDREDIIDGKYPLGNRLYRYELENNKLVRPRLLLDLPVSPNRHPGGQIQIGTDQDVCITIGDLDHNTKAQNNKTIFKVQILPLMKNYYSSPSCHETK
jgi:glucose/arabinose dehydrogenase